MAKLTSLIRVRRRTVEQKQKALAELYRQADELTQEKARLQEQVRAESERLKGTDSVELMKYLGGYREAVRARIEAIEQAMIKLEHRIAAAREDMREAFAEQKKIEITAERRDAEEQKERDKKESQEQDERAIEAFRRREEDA